MKSPRRDAGYLYLTDIGPGDAATQRVVESSLPGLGVVVLDFDREGGLLGIEFLAAGTSPAD